MSIVELIKSIQNEGIKLYVSDGKLRCMAPDGVIPPALLNEIKIHKSEITRLLTSVTFNKQSVSKRPDSCGERLPLSFAQQRLWFLDQLNPGSPSYNIPTTMRLSGPLDVTALRNAFNAVVARHESLRTVFVSHEGHALQHIFPYSRLELPLLDLSSLPSTSREQRMQAITTAEAGTPFDLKKGPLLRFGLIRMDAQEHVAFVTMHHIVSDGWSMGVLTQELATLYSAFSRDLPNPLPPLSIQYPDFAHWQRTWLQDNVLRQQLDYWRQQLSDAPPFLELPTDEPRPKEQRFRGASFDAHISKTLTEKIHFFSRHHGATLFMTLMAVFQLLLAKLSSQKDICVGTPVANRHYVELEPLIGFFVNTLVIRTHLENDATVSELVSQVRQTTLAAYANQDLPFERLVDELNVPRDMSYSPLFQVMFSLQNMPTPALQVSQLQLQPVATVDSTAKFDIEVQFMETANGITGGWKFDVDLFHSSTIERWSRAFIFLLEQVVSNPEARLSELTILDSQQRHQLLVEWNETSVDYPDNQCLHTIFEEQVKQTPTAIALVCEDQSLTYAQLNQRANRLAHYLRDQGVGPDTCVGLCMQRSLELVVSIYAILKAGGAYVPIDPEYPVERIAFILSDTGAKLVLCQHISENHVGEFSAKTFYFDRDWQAVEDYPDTNPRTIATSANLAYVIYTSGSTGQPKGVAVAHGGVCDRMRWTQERYPLCSQDSVLLKTPFTFDVSVCEFFWPLFAGSRLVVAQPEGHKDPVYLSHIIDQHQITTAHFVPSMLQVFLEQLPTDSGTSLTRLICSGEALPLDLQQRCSEQLNAELHNLYGPTEASIHVTAWACDPRATYTSVPMGRPLANTDVYVLDQALNPVALGTPGELYIGGTGVARGYLNRAALTAQSFIPHPFSEHPGLRLYKTGDLVRYLADGNLAYLGRLDHQVKLRGLRIELGEIEAALRQHTAISETAVLLREDKPGQKRLAAYVVWQSPDTIVDWRDLTAALQLQLPDYMIPSTYTSLTEMPLTSSGKLDRKALPAPEMFSTQREFIAPRTSTEEVLAKIWEDVLKLEKIGIYDNFFELGGHSLLATQVISRIRKSFSIELPLKTIFTSPTLENLAVAISLVKENGDNNFSMPIRPAARTSNLPLSFSQQRFWFLNQIIPDNPFFNIPVALHLDGTLNSQALHKSFNILVARHEGLRTCFPTGDNGQARQIIHPRLEIDVPIIDLETLADNVKAATIKTYLSEETKTPFNLNDGPLIRVRLLKLSTTKHILQFTLHHIICDGWSLNILRREFEHIYNAVVENNPVKLPPLPLQYADFASWQHARLQGETLEKQLSYWRNNLNNMPPLLQLATDYPRPKIQTYNGAVEVVAIDKELTGKLKEVAQANDCTLFMVLMTAFNILLHRYSGQTDFAVGTILANRHYSELESIVGVFINTMPLRANLSGNPSFRELLQQTKTNSLGAHAHQDIPFELLVEKLQPERTTAYTPLYQVLFVLQNTPLESGKSNKDLKIHAGESPRTVAEHDLTLNLSESANAVSGILEYNTDLFSAQTAKNMVNHLHRIINQVADNPEILLSRVDILNHADKRIIETWNATETPVPDDDALHRLFESQALKTPDAVAVVFNGETITYSDLNSKANQLAHYIMEQGAGQGRLICVCFERSIDLVIAMIGILKSGNAYVPLDPDYPQERLRFMLSDIETPLVITQQDCLEKIPVTNTHVLCLDENWDMVGRYPKINPLTRVSTLSLAYTIYTSGSTGQPKGVGITHQGICNRLRWMQNRYQLVSSDRVLQKTPYSFDVSVWEFFWPLITGARMVLAKPEGHKDARYIQQIIDDHNITTIHFVPSMLQVFLEQLSQNCCQSLQRVICSGEALSNQLAQYFFARINAQLHNLYGPTEASIDVTAWACRAEEKSYSVPIGKPIANTETYILDQHLNPTPIGVPGELYLSGVGLAQGYVNRPALTAQAFIPHPFGKLPGARLYKTGDLARFLSDGAIEFLGRIDHQVKLRGHRIELGEIESALCRHPAVLEAVVLAREDNSGDQRLVAYVVPDLDYIPVNEAKSELNQKAIDQWKNVYDETYQLPVFTTEPFVNFSGWNSSYTNQPIATEEMLEWTEDTVARIKELEPKKVLEIGCGTGLLLGRLLADCDEYVGIDLSEQALNQIATDLAASNLPSERLTLFQGRADDLGCVDGKAFDTIILNSVVICFPSVEYLINVVREAQNVLSPNGKIFIGDVRHLGLLEAFHASVQFHKSANTTQKTELTKLIRSGIATDKDLVIDPSLFIALQQNSSMLGHVTISPKLSKFHNEMSMFRYDVVLYAGNSLPINDDISWESWEERRYSSEQIRDYLINRQPEQLALLAISNSRLTYAINGLSYLEEPGNTSTTLADVKRRIAQKQEIGIDPYELRDIAMSLGFETEFSWASSNGSGRYDVIIQRKESYNAAFSLTRFPVLKQETPPTWKKYANNPQLLTLQTDVLPDIRKHLKLTLPDYMTPSAIMFLDAFPLTANGKLDRNSLPNLGAPQKEVDRVYIPPNTEMERTIADVWSNLLGISTIGRNDNFFEIGGHSLLATRFVSRMRESFGIEFPLLAMFETPVLKTVSARIEDLMPSIASKLESPTCGNQKQWTCLVPLQSRGTKPPIFCVHPADGGVSVYMTLASMLGTDHPFYGLQACGLEPGQKPINSLDAMASHYFKEIKSMQATGPYCLAGWSGGGHIALELAQRLTANGDEVRSLFIIDTPAIMRISLTDDVSYITSIFKTGIEMSDKELRSLSSDELIRKFAERAKTGLLLSSEYSLEDAKRLFSVFKANLDISNSYTPSAYKGDTTFFAATLERGSNTPIDLSTYWKNFVNPDTRVIYVPGDHSSIIKQANNVQIIADQIRKRLKDRF
ncbi:MAG: amino acid adenylation domain-containing protein [Gammaproteobacteria bacterium]|nr:amino acid adenylation domain-containing protein [Gammaproteobacteria bacterium]